MHHHRQELTPHNYRDGMLLDEQLLAGIADEPAGNYAAFVLDYGTGTYVHYEVFPSIEQAIASLGHFERKWAFASTHACDNGKCGKNDEGVCSIGGCAKSKGGA